MYPHTIYKTNRRGTHLYLGGYFSREGNVSISLIVQFVEEVFHQASSQPEYLFVVRENQVLIVLAADLHAADSFARHHLQLPHHRLDFLLTLVGKPRRD